MGSSHPYKKADELTRPCSELQPCCSFPKAPTVASRFGSLCSSFPLPSRPLSPQKSAKLSFPECCQCSCSSVGKVHRRCNATTMVRPANHDLAPERHPAAACTLPASSFLLSQFLEQSSLPDCYSARWSACLSSSSSRLFFPQGGLVLRRGP